MKKINLIDALVVINVYKKLLPVARQLHNIAVRQCNGYANTDWGRKQEQRDITKESNLLNKAISLASQTGLQIFHQTDPRGVSLYLVTNKMDYTNYSSGIAIY